jgi:hypothetical protein
LSSPRSSFLKVDVCLDAVVAIFILFETPIDMNVHLLIDSIVRQTTVLIAQLATAGGVRAPLAHIANQVFVELAGELERQGVNRKVTADMFGISLRSYQRKTQRLRESSTERGRSLWEAILIYLEKNGVVTRQQILSRFHRDDETSVRGILRDLVENGLVFCSGNEKDAVFRLTTEEELGVIKSLPTSQGQDDLVWAIIFRDGPIATDRLAKLGRLTTEALDGSLGRLLFSGRISAVSRDNIVYYQSEKLVIPLGSSESWEASVYDHYHAVVKTICSRVDTDSESARYGSMIGGSTYTFDVGPDHPLEREVLDTLNKIRELCGDLRQRVVAYNEKHGVCHPHEQVVVYAGQCVIPQEDGKDTEQEGETQHPFDKPEGK